MTASYVKSALMRSGTTRPAMQPRRMPAALSSDKPRLNQRQQRPSKPSPAIHCKVLVSPNSGTPT
jgi:hypothetical protein